MRGQPRGRVLSGLAQKSFLVLLAQLGGKALPPSPAPPHQPTVLVFMSWVMPEGDPSPR